jgi:hypothetical protein
MLGIRHLLLGVVVSATLSSAPAYPPDATATPPEVTAVCDLCFSTLSGGQWIHGWAGVPEFCDTPQERQANQDCEKCTEATCEPGQLEGTCPGNPCDVSLAFVEQLSRAFDQRNASLIAKLVSDVPTLANWEAKMSVLELKATCSTSDRRLHADALLAKEIDEALVTLAEGPTS